MDPGNWGTDLQGGAQFKYGLLWVVALASLMAIFMQVLSARLGVVTGKDLAQACRDWYPALDALAQLAAVRTRDRRVRPRGSARQRRRDQPAVPHSAVLGRAHHRVRRACCCSRCSASACAPSRRSCWCWSRRSAPATSSRSSCCRRRSPSLRRDGLGAAHASARQDGHDVRGDRHHRRDGDAAQPLSAFGAGAEPQVPAGRRRRSARAIRFNTLDSVVALSIAFFVNAAILVLAAMVFYGNDSVTVAGRRTWSTSARQRLDSRRLSDARAAARHGGRPARCSPWRCWRAARAAPSPARSPGRS